MNKNNLIDFTWDEAQELCNFILFKPTWLPDGFVYTANKTRQESSKINSSHRMEFHDSERSLSIKQFLYDWAPPAYDHPCLWRNAKISTSENTPPPNAYLLGNNYLWYGLDYRRKRSFTINTMRTQVEITVLYGSLEHHEIIQIVKGLIPVNTEAKNNILTKSFAELMFNYRHKSKVITVPTSYFNHIRNENMICYPYPANSKQLDYINLAGNWLVDTSIENYSLDSLFLFGEDQLHIQEVEYYFESVIEPGTYVRFLVTKQNDINRIQFPPNLCDQECHYVEKILGNGEKIYHAWSKTNTNGCHSLIFKTQDVIINCIIKPAPWTTVDWARNICTTIIKSRI